MAYGPANLPRLHEIRLDGVVVGFTFVLSLLTGVAFGAIPLLRVAPLPASLHENGRGNTASRGRYRARHLLMGGQVALALVLVVSSGLMLRSFQKLRNVDPGLRPGVGADVSRRVARTASTRRRRAAVAVHQAILDRLSTIPGVTAVSASTCLPLTGACFGNGVVTERRIERRQTASSSSGGVASRAATSKPSGMRLLRGRSIDRGDVERGERSWS